jgi:hypothetical protein
MPTPRFRISGRLTSILSRYSRTGPHGSNYAEVLWSTPIEDVGAYLAARRARGNFLAKFAGMRMRISLPLPGLVTFRPALLQQFTLCQIGSAPFRNRGQAPPCSFHTFQVQVPSRRCSFSRNDKSTRSVAMTVVRGFLPGLVPGLPRRRLSGR